MKVTNNFRFSIVRKRMYVISYLSSRFSELHIKRILKFLFAQWHLRHEPLLFLRFNQCAKSWGFIIDGVLVCFVDGFNTETIFCKYNFVYSSGIYSSMESVPISNVYFIFIKHNHTLALSLSYKQNFFKRSRMYFLI